jgi:hypothetical protein
MKDVLLLHDNARPHTGLRTREAIAKMLWTVLPRPAHSPHLAPSDCHLFGPVKDALRGRHFVDVNELQQSFRDVLRSRGREFYSIGTQRLAQCWQKLVESDGDFVEKRPYNCKRCMNQRCKFHCYRSHISIAFLPPLTRCCSDTKLAGSARLHFDLVQRKTEFRRCVFENISDRSPGSGGLMTLLPVFNFL